MIGGVEILVGLGAGGGAGEHVDLAPEAALGVGFAAFGDVGAPAGVVGPALVEVEVAGGLGLALELDAGGAEEEVVAVGDLVAGAGAFVGVGEEEGVEDGEVV